MPPVSVLSTSTVTWLPPATTNTGAVRVLIAASFREIRRIRSAQPLLVALGRRGARYGRPGGGQQPGPPPQQVAYDDRVQPYTHQDSAGTAPATCRGRGCNLAGRPHQAR